MEGLFEMGCPSTSRTGEGKKCAGHQDTIGICKKRATGEDLRLKQKAIPNIILENINKQLVGLFTRVDYFTVVCSVTWPLDGSDARGNLAWMTFDTNLPAFVM